MHSDLVLNTVLEGVAKGVPGAVLEMTISTYRERLLFCGDIAKHHVHGKRGQKNRIDLLTDALFVTMNTGFDEQSIGEISTAVKGKSPSYFVNVLEVVIALDTMRIDPGQNITLVTRSISMGYTAAELQSIPSLYQTELKKGIPDELVYELLLKRIDSGESPSSHEADGRTRGGQGSPAGSSSGGSSGSGKSSKDSGSSGSGKGRVSGNAPGGNR
jgi:hypothetical protein